MQYINSSHFTKHPPPENSQSPETMQSSERNNNVPLAPRTLDHYYRCIVQVWIAMSRTARSAVAIGTCPWSGWIIWVEDTMHRMEDAKASEIVVTPHSMSISILKDMVAPPCPPCTARELSTSCAKVSICAPGSVSSTNALPTPLGSTTSFRASCVTPGPLSHPKSQGYV